jgi:hypothetical protein
MDPLSLATAAVTILSPYLLKAGEKAAEEVGKRLPDSARKLWNAISAKLSNKPVAAEAVKDLVAKPADQHSQAALVDHLRNVLEAEPAFAAELGLLLESLQRESSDTIAVTGPGAVATKGGVSAGAGGVAVKGDVHGGISIGGKEKQG